MATDQFDESEEQSGLPAFLMDPQGIVLRRWHWMLGVFLLTALAGAVFVALLPQTYQASARLLLTHQRISEELVRPASLDRIPELVNAVVGELLSRDSLIAVAATHDLAERMSIDAPAPVLVKLMRLGITVEPDLDLESQRHQRGAGEQSFILATRFESADPVVAADVANELANRFTSILLRRQNRQATLTTDFLRREARSAEEELARQRTRIAEFTKAHRGELPSELETKLASLERMQAQRHSLALQVSDAEGRLLVLGSQGAAGTEASLLAELRARLVHERTVYTDEHPNVIAVRRQIAALEAETGGGSSSGGRGATSRDPAVAAVQQEVEVLRGQSREVEQEIRKLEAAVAAIPSLHEEFAALQQREALLLEGFQEASRKVQEAELAESLQKAQQGFQVTQLDVAIPPEQSMRNRWKFAILAAAGAIGASMLIGVLLELIDPVIVAVRQLEAQTGTIPLGIIPRIR